MPQSFQAPRSKAEADPRRWLALGVLLLANFMNLIDVTIVNVALPSLQQGLGADSTHIQWIIAGFVLAFALGLLPFGRLGDIVGRTRMFLIGVGAFTFASALCGLAPNIETLVAARIMQGLAGGIMTPQVLAIVHVTFPPEEKGQAFSLFGLSAGLAAVAGPILGGVLIGANLWDLGWRPIFLVNIPIGILALVVGWFLIPRTPGNPGLRNDFVGIVLFALAAALLVFPLIEGRAYGWPLWAFGMIGSAFAVAAAFVLWERRMARADTPQLLNYSLITSGNFLLGMLVTTIFASGIPAMFMVIAMLLQVGYGFTPLESGLTNVPFSVGVLLVSLFVGRLGQRYLRGRLMLGSALLVIGISWLDIIIRGLGDAADQWVFLPPLLLAGIGLGLAFSGLFQAVLSGVPARDAGSGAGALQAFQQVGGAIGVAIVGELFFTHLGSGIAAGNTTQVAHADAASLAVIFQIVTFATVVVLVPLLKVRRLDQKPADQPSAAE